MLTKEASNQKTGASAEFSGGSLGVRLPKFGVLIFDNPKDPVDGWGCQSDGEAFRFRQPSDLPTDCIWVCNVDGGSQEFRSRFARMHHMRPSEYLRSNLKHIAADLGLYIDGEGRFGGHVTTAAPKIAKIVHRAILYATQVYGWTDPAQILRSESLHEDIRRAMIVPPPLRDFMRGPMSSAYQSYSSPDKSGYYESDSVSVTLRYNRLSYAKKIMATEVPDGAWAFVDGGMSMKDALNPGVPCLVEASVETSGIDPEISSLVAFGATPNRRGPLRNWISQRELFWLSQYAKVHIVRAYRATSSALLPERIQLPRVLTEDPTFEFSLSAGLVAESHWAAIVNPVYNSRAGTQEKRETSQWGVWLRAADRAFSFELALAAHKAGFMVLGYGNGSVVVRLRRDRLGELLDFAMENNIAHPVFRQIFEQNGIIEK